MGLLAAVEAFNLGNFAAGAEYAVVLALYLDCDVAGGS